MARPEKVEQVEALAEIFTNARSVVLNDFTGLDVAKISELRRLCREAGIEYRVVKNTLAKRSLKGTPAEALDEHFEGPTALAIGREDENTSAKVLADFAKEHEAPKFKAAVVEGNVIDATGVLALAKLPSKDELLSKLLGSMKSPGNNLVSVLQGPLRSFMYVMNAIMDKKTAEGDTGAAPEAAPAEEAAPAAEAAPAEAAPAEEAPEAGDAAPEEPKEEDKK